MLILWTLVCFIFTMLLGLGIYALFGIAVDFEDRHKRHHKRT